ncbi:hypothetical protein GUJ93_ZPchr0010g7495 [Zizania palustris]|uniref:J domain-containing protein n=1 Tax=Zizania palustris TaxID=103762 RepID=A0A8J6BAT7_ZIZPA|nr:hypothetical protein GUJ93_ZPchr0010g7495 [Zizania palustris]
MQAAARRCFHSSASALSKSTPHIRFSVREKRGDAKAALKNILLNGGPCQESSNKQKRQQKGSTKSKLKNSSYGKDPHRKGGQNWRNFDEDNCNTPYGNFGGKKSFTWYWPGENNESGNPSGFQWRDESQSTKSRKRVWNESDVDEEEYCGDDLQNHRVSLGLPPLGPLDLDHIKSAFRASALRWHPDKHQGASQVIHYIVEAAEKFKRCVEAYKALAGASKPSG